MRKKGFKFARVKNFVSLTYSFIYIRSGFKFRYAMYISMAKHWEGTSLVVPWLRIHLSMQETWVQPLVREESTCCGETKPMHHNYWSPCALEPGLPNRKIHHEKPPITTREWLQQQPRPSTAVKRNKYWKKQNTEKTWNKAAVFKYLYLRKHLYY